MNNCTSKFISGTLLFCCASINTIATPGSIDLQPIGSYASGVFDQGASEIVAHDPATQRIFVVNAQSATVDVLSILDPTAPVRVATIDVKPYGAVANSVAVKNGVIAVAVENAVKTDPGVVVFFDADLQFTVKVEVGALPDMLTFSPNGRFVLVANEGEPSNDYKVDPEGSISIIDISSGVANITQANVRTADFRAFNSGGLDPAVRIFGPGASVAQDIEPEYITVSSDSKTAWVTCQENNAIAIVNINSAKVMEVVPLGAKDHSAVVAKAEIHEFHPATMPVIGTTIAGQSLFLGGFSGLHFEGINPVTGRFKFIAHTDRGPNAEPTGIFRPFLLPDFTPEIVRFEFNPADKTLSITQRIPLQRAPGQPLTGRPNTALSANASQPYNDEVPVDLLGNVLPIDPLGGDFEGIVADPTDGSFWMVDEYRPAIYHFDGSGILIKRYVPVGTAAAAGEAAGTFGDEVLPAALAQRRQNRGFEGVAFDGGKVYAFTQSPLRNPSSLANSALNGMRNLRIVEFNPSTLATKQYLYILDNPNLGPEPNTRADKLGDAVSIGNGEFLVIERDDDALPDDNLAAIEKKIYRFNLAGATDISVFTGTVGATGKTVDELSAPELAANGIHPVEKILYVDLNQAGYNRAQKVEGLAVIDPWTLAVINDNDFGVANITVNSNGTFTLNYLPEKTQLGIIHIRHNGLDTSDRDGKINIRPWPVKGLYMPDAIASYRVGAETFLVTANEGDVREWGSFVESVRVGSSSVVLDTNNFRNPTVLKNNANLGRLNITTASGRNPLTGVFEELYTFGARSFSIWNSNGRQVFDSGDDFEWLTAMRYPTNFNSSHTANEFDTRSDDKGPEPEGVIVEKVFGRDYAFIALERIGGIMVYDVSDPRAPFFVDYKNFRNFNSPPATVAAGDLGPEGLIFIKAEDSPVGNPLIVVGNEVSGTTTIYEIKKVE